MALPSITQLFRRWYGLLRSVVVYYGNPFKLRRMRRFYAQFITPGDLCFDIGAHVGNRLHVWVALGAQVVGVEPQPACMALLRRWFGRSPTITLVEAAVGDCIGEATLWVSAATPTVSSLSRPWIDAMQTARSFAGVRWEEQVAVPVTTLDALIAQHGAPVFCKIDVEGYELAVLHGLSQPLRALSFEYLPASIDVALGCVARLCELGDYEFNWSLGEQHRWEASGWLTGEAMGAALAKLALGTRSGDVYARLR